MHKKQHPKVQTGSSLVDDAGHTMGDIVNQVRHVTDLIGEISSATHEQTSRIELVSGAVGSWTRSRSRTPPWWRNQPRRRRA